MSTKSSFILQSSDDVAHIIKEDVGSPKESLVSLAKYLYRMAEGSATASLDMRVNEVGGVQASGTVTFSSLAATDTVTVGNQVFTASATPSGNNQFLVTGGDTAAAAAFAAAVNAHPALAGVVTASPSAAVTTITAVANSLSGNMIDLAISAHGSVSAAHLAGGLPPTSNIMHAGL